MATTKRSSTRASKAAKTSAASQTSEQKDAVARPKSKTAKAASAKSPRTAGGKRANPERLAAAQAQSREGLRERTEEGHRAAGRTPPSQLTAKRSSGAVRKIDDDLRDFVGPVTEDEKLLRHRWKIAALQATSPAPTPGA